MLALFVLSSNRQREPVLASELILIRHGQTTWNVERRLQGRGDSPLTDTGRAQVRAHLEWLRACPPAALLASPLGRVRATVEILAPDLGLAPNFEDALSERCMGCFEGWTLEEIAAAAPEQYAQRERDPWHWRPPGGENYEDLLARTAPVVERLRRDPARRLLVVSHGTLMRPLLGQLLELDSATMLQIKAPNDLAYYVDLSDPARPAVRRRHDGDWVPGLLLRSR